MYLEQLSITDFKNIASATLRFSPHINCIIGNNGEGKTNLLDAIYCLSMTKSYFGGSDLSNIRHGQPFFLLQGCFQQGESAAQVHCGVQRDGGKVIKHNNKVYQRLTDHIGLFPLVMISPTDHALINESGEERRKYLNGLLSQFDREYLNAMLRYNHILLQRNKLLKTPLNSGAMDVLLTLNEQLGQYGQLIYERRRQLVENLQPYFQKIYTKLSKDKEEVSLGYRSDLDKGLLTDLLQQHFERDKVLQHTSTGIHRDDLTMHLDGYPLRRTGSQGQQKTYLLALKLAQFDLLYQRKGFHPLLLLDDIFDKLDAGRIHELISLVAHEAFGQIFFTDSNKVRLNSMVQELTGNYATFTAEGGTFNQ
ncbi:MAG: DNA replication and repair protein RecF [Prevotellaceae bacterium]|jgi:DNA replication and repair protein RecF|nr:DNA replication and repair protein RecF [Prevotellaceae bacterium]